MSTENAIVNAEIKTGKSVESVKSLKSQLKDVVGQLAEMEEGSKAFVETAKKAGVLKDKIGDLADAVDAFGPEKKFQAFANVLGGVANGFAVVQGSAALFGAENKNVEAAILKTQAAMAVATGLNGLMGMGDAFKNLKLVAKDTFGSIKAALIATGIGAFTVALGLIIGNWDKIKGLVSGATQQQEKLNLLAQKQVEIEQNKLKHLTDQESILRLQGKSEREILESKIAQSRQVALSIMLAAEAQQKMLDAKKANNKKQSRGPYGFFNKLLFGSSDSDLAEDQKAIDDLKKAFSETFGQMATFKLAVEKIEDDAAKKAEEKRKTKLQQDIEWANKRDQDMWERMEREAERIADGQQREREARERAELERQEAVSTRKASDLSQAEKDLADESFTLDERRKMLRSYYDAGIIDMKRYNEIDADFDKKRVEQKRASYASIASSLMAFSGAVGEQTAEGKALASASVTISTIMAAFDAYTSTSKAVGGGWWGAALGAIAAGAVAAYGYKQVSAINAVNVPGGRGGGGSFSVPSAPAPPPPPSNRTTLTNGGEAILTRSLDVKNQKVYVLESDITNTQDKARNIRNRATVKP